MLPFTANLLPNPTLSMAQAERILRRPALRCHDQQHRERGPFAPADRRGGVAPVPQAEHELAVPLRLDDAVLRAAGRAAADRGSAACSLSIRAANRRTSPSSEASCQAVRAAGGLCSADEVQVGPGRTGATFWAFEHEQVTPDILLTAEATAIRSAWSPVARTSPTVSTGAARTFRLPEAGTFPARSGSRSST